MFRVLISRVGGSNCIILIIKWYIWQERSTSRFTGSLIKQFAQQELYRLTTKFSESAKSAPSQLWVILGAFEERLPDELLGTVDLQFPAKVPEAEVCHLNPITLQSECPIQICIYVFNVFMWMAKRNNWTGSCGNHILSLPFQDCSQSALMQNVAVAIEARQRW